MMTAFGAIAPSAFALSSSVHTGIDAPVFQSNDQTSSPRTTATEKTTQINSPSSDILSGGGDGSFGVGVANQNNDQTSTTSVTQNVNIGQTAANFNLQGFDVHTTSTLFCIFSTYGIC